MVETADLAHLLAHADWLRALARQLVGSASADDVVQETFVAALRSPPDAERPPRPWLARVMRNITRMRFRSDAQRVVREDAIASATVESLAADDATQRLEAHRMLCELVLGLDEPFRHTMVQHYFDDLTMAEIARRDRVPESTVRSRHKQALDRLRARLDARSGGDRRAWIGSVAPIAAPVAKSGWLVIGGGLLVKKVVIGAVLVVAVAAITWTQLGAPPPDPVATTSAATVATGATNAPTSTTSAPTPAEPRRFTRLATTAERQLTKDRIALAQSKRRANNPAAPSLPEAPTMSKVTIRDAMREAIPYVQECYERALPTLSTPDLRIKAHLVLRGDPDVGTIVDAPQPLVDEHDQPLPASLDDCLRSTFQLLELPPLAEGDELVVNYPLRFRSVSPASVSPEPAGSESGWRTHETVPAPPDQAPSGPPGQ
jgi:RNA polymerase sigma-70 factor (ECF subfamily)